MKKPFVAFGLWCGLALLGRLDACAQLLLLGTNAVSLGRVCAFDVKRVPFVFTNAGGEAAQVTALRPTCGCVRGDADRTDVPPGGTSTVRLQFTPDAVHGAFSAGLWVGISDPEPRQLYLTVYGEVTPLVTGQPDGPIPLEAADVNVIWTNRFTLIPTDERTRLGAPQVETDANLKVGVAQSETNVAGRAAYAVTLIVTPQTSGRHKALVSFPLLGRPDVPPVRFDLYARAGRALTASPGRIELPASDVPVSHRLLLRTDEPGADAGLLTWDPRLAGLSVEAGPLGSGNALLVTVRFTPDAVARLRAMNAPRLTFRYPRHTPATVLVHAVREESGTRAGK